MGDGCDISSRWAQASVEISLRVGNQADARGSGGGVDDVLGRLGSSGGDLRLSHKVERALHGVLGDTSVKMGNIDMASHHYHITQGSVQPVLSNGNSCK